MGDMRRLPSLLLTFMACGFAAGCSGISDPSKNTTQDFTATLQPFGGQVHSFDVSQKNGEYSATLIAVSPTQNSIFRIFLGQDVRYGNCSPIVTPTLALLNRVALSGTITKGNYCIQVYDQGAITEAADLHAPRLASVASTSPPSPLISNLTSNL